MVLAWYLQRLRSMSVAEMGWRAGRVVMTRVGGLRPAAPIELDWEASLAGFRARRGILNEERAQEIASAAPELVRALVAAADDAVAGRVRFFGYPGVTLVRPIDWNYDPVADVRWPGAAASDIDHRTARGDVKWIWELNRLQHLPWLAQAWLFTGDERYSEAAWGQLDGWLTQCPPGRGIAWRGAFEAGVRAISVAVAVQGLRDAPGLTVARYRSVAQMLAESARRCWTERSRFSSANNHLVGELAGLAAVALVFPDLPGAQGWRRRAVSELAVQAERQILPDGAGAEQAVGYQMFTVELMAVVAALLRNNGEPVPAELSSAIERSTEYLGVLVGSGDPDPRYGDDDEGFAVRLGPDPVRTVRDHLDIVGGGTATLAGCWLRLPALPASDGRSRYFPDGGMVVLRAGTRRVTMDVGPLGYLSLAAHGHADALSVTVAHEGQEVVTDPGTGSYYGHPDWRRAHRGTASHATVTVAGADQSVLAGPFLWRSHAQVRVRCVDLARGVVDAEHDGYSRLRQAVTHRRWLIAPPGEEVIVVVDMVTGTGSADAVSSWPLHPDIELGESWRLTHAATAPLVVGATRGDAETNLGWWSPRLESRRPAWLVTARTSGELPLVMVTVLARSDQPDLTVRQVDGEIIVEWGARLVRLDSTRDGAVTCN